METAVERGQGGHHQQRCHHRHHDHHRHHRQGLALVGRVGVVICWAYLYLIACAVPARCVSAAATPLFSIIFLHTAVWGVGGGGVAMGVGGRDGSRGWEGKNGEKQKNLRRRKSHL